MTNPTEHQLNLMAVKFDNHYEPVPECGCWIWLGPVRNTNSGPRPFLYVYSGWNKTKDRQWHVKFIAARVAHLLYVGPIPYSLHVLHRCDQSLCVNPQHLFVGTHRKNMEDCAAKGRIKQGKTRRKVPLDVKDKNEIKQRYLGGEFANSIATDYMIDRTYVYKLAKGAEPWQRR